MAAKKKVAAPLPPDAPDDEIRRISANLARVMGRTRERLARREHFYNPARSAEIFRDLANAELDFIEAVERRPRRIEEVDAFVLSQFLQPHRESFEVKDGILTVPDKRRKEFALWRKKPGGSQGSVAEAMYDRAHPSPSSARGGGGASVKARNYTYGREPRSYGSYHVYKSTVHQGESKTFDGPYALAEAKDYAKTRPYWGSGIYGASEGRWVGWINQNGNYVPFRRR